LTLLSVLFSTEVPKYKKPDGRCQPTLKSPGFVYLGSQSVNWLILGVCYIAEGVPEVVFKRYAGAVAAQGQ
jgi:hypothetical protein